MFQNQRSMIAQRFDQRFVEEEIPAGFLRQTARLSRTVQIRIEVHEHREAVGGVRHESPHQMIERLGRFRLIEDLAENLIFQLGDGLVAVQRLQFRLQPDGFLTEPLDVPDVASPADPGIEILHQANQSAGE